MKKSQWLAILMGITILGITGFQLYWLRENYDREKKSVTARSEIIFHDAVIQLQVSKLRLDGIQVDSSKKGNLRIFGGSGIDEQVNIRFRPKEEMVSTINILRTKIADSSNKRGIKESMVITMDKSRLRSVNRDSIRFTTKIPPAAGKRNHVLQLLYGIDSLQDSIRVEEIDSAYRVNLNKEKLDIPFNIIKVDSSEVPDIPPFNMVTVGFANPVTYRLQLGNTFPYLIRRISLPILFSIILLGITILSFVLLYRNLLRQRRLAEVKNEFISNITHELKTPIATVGVAIEALKNFNAMQDPERTREYLDISSNELQRLNLLVDKVLRLSMFEKKAIDLKFETLNLEDVVTEVVSSMRLQLEKNNAAVSVNTEGDSVMQGDKHHLQSVVFNLLDNALKYNRRSPVIKINLSGQIDKVTLSIEDNGVGIAPEYKNKIFEKFFRIPHGDTHDAKGYGLGLSYAAHIVRQHNGTIEIENQAGMGSTFTITLPRQKNGSVKS
jgi:two-component system, OmpR family, phosphate regulon sensor histidine kinase PhoR